MAEISLHQQEVFAQGALTQALSNEHAEAFEIFLSNHSLILGCDDLFANEQPRYVVHFHDTFLVYSGNVFRHRGYVAKNKSS